MMTDRIEELCCPPEMTVRLAMATLNRVKGLLLAVVDAERRLLGVVTDSDIRRGILQGIPLTAPVSQIMNPNPKKLSVFSKKKAAEIMKQYSIKQVPIVDEQGRFMDIILWENVIDAASLKDESDLVANAVLVMAGGKGQRLDPVTKILPKPLVPIGEHPIIEIVIDRCRKCGFSNFIVSLNYKASMIRHYFAETDLGVSIRFVQEDKPLGTAGSIYLAREFIKESFIVTNCDVIIDIDYRDLLDFHIANGFQITMVGVLKDFTIPYGVIKMNNGHLIDIEEKPVFDLVVNAGVYALEPEVLNHLSANTPVDMPELLMKTKEAGGRVGVYPFSGKWIDVGQWEEYRKVISNFVF